jgi:PKD repeat protein
MALTTVTPETLKAAMLKAGYTVSTGTNWTATDYAAYSQYVSDLSYAAGVQPDDIDGNYGLAYPPVMPLAIENAVNAESFTATVAGAPLTGAYATTPVTWTATVTAGGPATSYAWNLGDGSAIQTTTEPTITYTYKAAGSFTASVVPTVDTVKLKAIYATEPAVLTA